MSKRSNLGPPILNETIARAVYMWALANEVNANLSQRNPSMSSQPLDHFLS